MGAANVAYLVAKCRSSKKFQPFDGGLRQAVNVIVMTEISTENLVSPWKLEIWQPKVGGDFVVAQSSRKVSRKASLVLVLATTVNDRFDWNIIFMLVAK